jgi:hypothetical protein
MASDYQELVEMIKDYSTAFYIQAKDGEKGRGFRKHGLVARKLSLKLVKMLTDFRTISVMNDKGILVQDDGESKGDDK